jgi:enhancer of polycomb-like protein
MDDEDVEFLSKLNEGKDADGRDRRDSTKLNQCSEDTFEEVMNFFEETSARIQPYANVDNAPILSLEEMKRSIENNADDGLSTPLSAEAHKWLKPIYKYWVVKKGNRPLMPTIKVRVLDTASDADDTDPYVCFRRREVRQTRKTRGRDAQVTEKLKKLRHELDAAHKLVQMVVQREKLNAESLTVNRKVFNERRQLKEVKITKNIIGDKGDDEELLVDQKVSLRLTVSSNGLRPTDSSQRATKPKARPSADGLSQRPGPTLRLRTSLDRASAAGADNDLAQLEDFQQESAAFVTNTIEARKEQHKKWNQHWEDETKRPITPPIEESDPIQSWSLFPPEDFVGAGAYPSPPASNGSQEPEPKQENGDVEMADAPPSLPPSHPAVQDVKGGAPRRKPLNLFHVPGSYPESSPEPEEDEEERIIYEGDSDANRSAARQYQQRHCRLRRGRGGRLHLESRRKRKRSFLEASSGVVSDAGSDSDDPDPPIFTVSDRLNFDYRVALNRPSKADAAIAQQQQLAAGYAHGHPAPGAMQQHLNAGAGAG